MMMMMMIQLEHDLVVVVVAVAGVVVVVVETHRTGMLPTTSQSFFYKHIPSLMSRYEGDEDDDDDDDDHVPVQRCLFSEYMRTGMDVSVCVCVCVCKVASLLVFCACMSVGLCVMMMINTCSACSERLSVCMHVRLCPSM